MPIGRAAGYASPASPALLSTQISWPWALAALIGITLVLRVLLAGAMGLGIDESYMVAAGRHLHLGYYDHPPAAWWLAWAGAHLFGTDTPLAVRVPFILLFALSTVLLYRLTARLYGDAAAFWAACLLNAAPVLSITTGTFVLPDGPVIVSLLGVALCLEAACRPDGRSHGMAWLGAGVCAGIALDCKYTAILSLAGAAIYAATCRRAPRAVRPWLARPEPYAAALVALAIFTPVMAWNADHGWMSFAFQGGRIGGKFHPAGPLTALLSQAIVVLPWLFVPMLVGAAAALRRGPADAAGWLPVCLGLPPILFFLVLSPFVHVLPHWPVAGFVMLLPILGNGVAVRLARPWMPALMLTTGIVTVAGTAFVASEVHFNWLPEIFETFTLGNDPDLQLVDWRSLEPELAARGLLTRPGTVFAGLRWHEAGKIDYALGPSVRVICICADPREYGLAAPVQSAAGQDVVLIATHATLPEMRAQYGQLFAAIDQLEPAMVLHAQKPAMLLPLFLGHDFRPGIPTDGPVK